MDQLIREFDDPRVHEFEVAKVEAMAERISDDEASEYASMVERDSRRMSKFFAGDEPDVMPVEHARLMMARSRVRPEVQAYAEEIERVSRQACRGVPARLISAALEHNDPTTNAMATAIKFWESDKWALLLAGKSGRGKSVAAAWVLSRSTRECYWINAQEMSANVFKDEWFARVSSCHVLVIDEIGAEYASDKGPMVAMFDSLMNERWGKNLRTVITTNMDRDGFVSRYGDRVWSRLRDGMAVQVAGEDLRG